MAGTVGDATIGINVNANTSGLDKAQEELNKLVELAKKAEKPFKLKLEASGNGESKLVDQMKKAEELATKTNEAMRKIGTSSVGTNGLRGVNEALESMQKRLSEANAAQKKLGENASYREQNRAWGETTKSVNQYANALKKVQQLQRESERSYQTKQRSSMVDERAQMLSEQRKQKAALADERLKQAQMRTQLIGSGGSSRSKGSSGEDWRWRGKLKSSAAETAGMYSLGMLGANAIMSAGEKVKELFASGYGYATTQSSMKQNWSTLVNGNGASGLSSSKAGNANKIVDTITQQAMENGRGISLVNHGWQQIYHSTDNAQQTNHLMRSALRVGDAMGLTDDEQKHFNQYGISHILDRGYVNGMALNQIEPYDPALKDDLTRAYLAKQKHVSMSDISMDEVEKQRKNLRAWVTAKKIDDTLFKKALNYEGDTKWPDASKKMLSSLSGMRRSLETGVPAAMKNFEDAFSKPLQKSMGGLFYKISHSFVDGTAEKKATQFGTSLAGVSKAMYSAGKAVAPLVKSFGGCFVDGIKSFANSVKSAWHVLSGVGKSIGNMFGSGGGGALKDLLHTFGSLSGKAVGLVALGKLLRHIPIVGNSINSLFSKIPIIGKAFAVNTSAGSKMMSAADTMMSAANKMNGSSGSGGVDGSGNVPLTLEKKLANSKFSSLMDKTFIKGLSLAGKGGIKGIIGKGLMYGSKFLYGSGIKGASILEKIGGSTFGKIIGGISKRGGFGLNALFAGLDVMSALKNNKVGTKARHMAVGSAIGGGIGGTLGTYIGSFLGPVGTIAGGIGGTWLGNKAGSWIGSKVKSITGTIKKVRSAMTSIGSVMQKIPGLGAIGTGMKFLAHPIKMLGDFKKTLSGIGSKVKSITGTIKKIHFPKLSNLFKGFKLPHFNIKNIFKGWKLPHFNIKNPFKGWKLPHFKLPHFNIKNPFKGWKLPHIKLPHFKIKNPFKGFKLPKLHIPNWIKNVAKWISGADKSTKKASASTKKVGDNAKSSSKSSKTMWNGIKKGAMDAWNATKKTVGKISSGVKKELGKVGKGNPLKGLSSKIKSGLNKGKSTAKSAAKGIYNAVKSGLKNVGRGAKSSMNGISKAVKSGMNKAKSAARSGSRTIGTAIKSGLRKASSDTKSAMNKVSSSVKSGMRKAASSAKSGANKIVSSVKSGMNKVGSATKSSMSKVSEAVKSGMDKANSSMKSAFGKMVSTAQSATSKVASSFSKIGSGAASASGKVRALASAINALHSKTVNIKVNVSGKGASKLATGTAGALNAFSSIPKYANGVGGHKGGVAIVNDSKGANWREAFMLPNGRFGMFPKVKNLMVDLPRGTQVLNGNDTARKMPHYANGTPKPTKRKSGGIKVVIENINVSGSTDKAQAKKVAKMIRDEVQEVFAGQLDMI